MRPTEATHQHHVSEAGRGAVETTKVLGRDCKRQDKDFKEHPAQDQGTPVSSRRHTCSGINPGFFKRVSPTAAADRQPQIRRANYERYMRLMNTFTVMPRDDVRALV